MYVQKLKTVFLNVLKYTRRKRKNLFSQPGKTYFRSLNRICPCLPVGRFTVILEPIDHLSFPMDLRTTQFPRVPPTILKDRPCIVLCPRSFMTWSCTRVSRYYSIGFLRRQ